MSEHLALLEARRAGLLAELQAVNTAIRTLGGVVQETAAAVEGLAVALEAAKPDGRKYRPRLVPMIEVPYLVERFKAAIANGPISMSALRKRLGVDYHAAIVFVDQMVARDPSIQSKGDGRGRRVGRAGDDFSTAYRQSADERPESALREARAILDLIDRPLTISELGAKLEQASLNGARWRLAEMLKAGQVKRVGRFYLKPDMEAPAGLEAMDPIARQNAMTVVAVLEAAGIGLRMMDLGPKLTDRAGKPLALAGYRHRVGMAVKLGLVKRTGSVYHLEGQAIPPNARQTKAAERAEETRRRREAREAAKAAKRSALPPRAESVTAPSVEGVASSARASSFRCHCGETRREAFRASEPRQCKACRRAYNANRRASLRAAAPSVPGDDASNEPARRLKFSRGKRDDQGDDLAKRRIMEFLSLEDLTVPELAAKIKRTASEASRLLLELHAERKVRRVGSLAWATRFVKLTALRDQLEERIQVEASEAVAGPAEGGRAEVYHPPTIAPRGRELDDFEPVWNGALERQGRAPGLSSHSGNASLAGAHTASTRGVDHVSKV